jgi:hypothetical protein
MYTHYQNNQYVALFAGLHLRCSSLPNAKRCLCISPTECNILTLGSCHLSRYSLPFAYIAWHCICFDIIVFSRSETYCPIFTLSSTILSVLQSMCLSIIGLRCVFLLIRICIVAIVNTHTCLHSWFPGQKSRVESRPVVAGWQCEWRHSH